jgi:hypothetical protein
MKRPLELSDWDFPDSDWEPDGYDMKQAPALSKANLQVLISEHNNLVEVVNHIASVNNVDLDDLS